MGIIKWTESFEFEFEFDLKDFPNELQEKLKSGEDITSLFYDIRRQVYGFVLTEYYSVEIYEEEIEKLRDEEE